MKWTSLARTQHWSQSGSASALSLRANSGGLVDGNERGRVGNPTQFQSGNEEQDYLWEPLSNTHHANDENSKTQEVDYRKAGSES